MLDLNLPAVNRLARVLIRSDDRTKQNQHGHGVSMMQPIDEEVVVA